MPGGAPVGNHNAAKAKRWQQAIDRALAKRSKAAGIEELDRLAELFLQAVEDMTVPTDKRGPSIDGFKELGDRVEGKVTQPISGDPDGTPLVVNLVQFAAIAAPIAPSADGNAPE